MITRDDAERVAAEWARRETARRGYECTPMLSEFDLGYVVWFRQPAAVRLEPGDATPTVIDKETGELTSYPAVPPHVIGERYRRHRAARRPARRSVDAEAALRREIARVPTPTTAAHLTVGDERFTARGAKGDRAPDHHPLVRGYLDELPPGHLVRGGARHAELVVLSDALYALDRPGGAGPAAGEPDDGTGPGPEEGPDGGALTLDRVRRLLASSMLETFRVREPGDPTGGAARPCESCLRALVHFGVLPWPDLAFAEERRPFRAPDEVPNPRRFPAEVAAALVEGGWRSHLGGEVGEVLADTLIGRVVAIPGSRRRHEAFPAARRAIADFPGIISGRRGPGERVFIRPLTLDPVAAAYTADALADLGARIGRRLFPIGTEGPGDTVLAIDEQGRVFALDQSGEWLVGTGLDQALTNLILGRAAARVRDDGTW